MRPVWGGDTYCIEENCSYSCVPFRSFVVTKGPGLFHECLEGTVLGQTHRI
jgi:hypothetical protein